MLIVTKILLKINSSEVSLKRERTSRTLLPVNLSSCLWAQMHEFELKLHKVHFESRACKAEDNLSVKSITCNPNVNKEVAKYPNVELARQEVQGC